MAPKRRSWASIKRAKAASEGRRAGYRQAKDAFELAERVRQARERMNITQAELAKRIGSTQPAIARVHETGVGPRVLKRAAARRVSTRCDVSPWHLGWSLWSNCAHVGLRRERHRRLIGGQTEEHIGRVAVRSPSLLRRAAGALGGT
ncbi:MAG: helix-turn-helix transcriptional regulator [Candidatus Binatia bacterium]